MPSGRTHDKITLAIAPPTFGLAWLASGDLQIGVITTLAMLAGGLMFGPDLDIDSTQYRRWGPLRWIWLPYRGFIRHRSRLSHGILFGTAIRVAYFLVVVGLVLTLAIAAREIYLYRAPAEPGLALEGAERVWTVVGGVAPVYHAAAFTGLWVGAASHTLADIVGSTVKAIWNAL